jgi:hypothetical protein
MRRLLAISTALLLSVSAAAIAATHHRWRPVAHAAWIQLGCCDQLHVSDPTLQGNPVIDTYVQTGSYVTGTEGISSEEACVQVENSGSWFTKSETCKTQNPGLGNHLYTWDPGYQDAACGHVYRAWAWAKTNSGSTNTYEGSGHTVC